MYPPIKVDEAPIAWRSRVGDGFDRPCPPNDSGCRVSIGPVNDTHCFGLTWSTLDSSTLVLRVENRPCPSSGCH